MRNERESLRPANGTYLIGDGTVGGNTLGVTPGSDGTTPQDPDYLAAFALLDTIRDVNIIAVPGIGSKAVVESGEGYCQNRMDCFFIGDMSSVVDSKEAAQSFVNSLTVKSSYGAVYFPWLTMVDPSGRYFDDYHKVPAGTVTFTLANGPPIFTTNHPAHNGYTGSLTPSLWVDARDPDNFPAGAALKAPS